MSCPPTASSVASPNTVLRERERASRKLQNLSPLSPNDLEPFESAGSYFGALGGGGPTRPRDPFAGSGVVEPTREFDAPRHALQPAHEHPFTQVRFSNSSSSFSWMIDRASTRSPPSARRLLGAEEPAPSRGQPSHGRRATSAKSSR